MQLLPMAGKTHGSRSAVTCHYKCDSACAVPAPNLSAEPTFRDVAGVALSRRSVLLGGGALAAAAAIPLSFESALPALATEGTPFPGEPPIGGSLPFTPIQAVDAAVDEVTVPEGYDWQTVVRWGDPLFNDSPDFRAGAG